MIPKFKIGDKVIISNSILNNSEKYWSSLEGKIVTINDYMLDIDPDNNNYDYNNGKGYWYGIEEDKGQFWWHEDQLEFVLTKLKFNRTNQKRI